MRIALRAAGSMRAILPMVLKKWRSQNGLEAVGQAKKRNFVHFPRMGLFREWIFAATVH